MTTCTSFFSRPVQAALALVLLAAPAVAACKGGSAASDAGSREGGPSASASATGLPAPPDVAAPPADAMRTADGLASKVLTPGTGADKPARTTR